MGPSRGVLTSEPEPQENVASIRGDATIARTSVEGWLHDHLNGVALTVVIATFGARLFAASRSFLNPDEALHYAMINQPSAFLAYKASLTNAHPPLMYLIVYFWRFLGHSELMLRLPSVLAGAALCWVIFKWIGNILGEAAGLIGLMVAALCPAVIAVSIELRQYAVLLFCMVTALYFLDRSFSEMSLRSMWWFTLFLYLAILSHYSAIFFALAVGVYSLVRIADSRVPPKVMAGWAIGQAGVLAIYGFLYVTHVSKLKGAITVWGVSYDSSYFHGAYADLLPFLGEHTSDVFQYLFGQRYVAEAIFLLFGIGLVFLFARDFMAPRNEHRPHHVGFLLLLPFVAIGVGAVTKIYPYVGDRHTIFLAPFAIAAVSCVLARVAGQKLWASLLITAVLMGAANLHANSDTFEIAKENQRRASMVAAVNHVQQSIPKDNLILVDLQSTYPIEYYLCGRDIVVPHDTPSRQFSEFSCGGYSIVSTSAIWKLTFGTFATQFQQMAQAYGLKPGDRVWVFQTGWGVNLDETLASEFPKFHCLNPKSFGHNLTVIPFVVGPDFLPATLSGNC